MSLKSYTVINCFLLVLTSLFFTIISSISKCLVQADFSSLLLYIFRNAYHIFEMYNLLVISSFLLTIALITYCIKSAKKFIFIVIFSIILIVVLNLYDLKAFFIYKSQSVDQYFYTYLISYFLSFVFWYITLKKIWRISFIENSAL
ncbi:hypothetical protein CHRY9393_01478 [Chryseobacterium fistulae]|uniref:Uncharacterized protein n=1 Tax=Chryseobacterium fistulae TaxID=2675058 RepID=A0A6N4XR69_9FLAO|nr:hypothetical protein CHRY9393_01478 [Chryseobacterium fistulae]